MKAAVLRQVGKPLTIEDVLAARMVVDKFPDVRFIMAGSGHIAGVINPPAARKYQYWTNEALPPSLDGWMADAVETPGSWWPPWVTWLKARSGRQIPARNERAGPLPALEDAPGSYVKVRS